MTEHNSMSTARGIVPQSIRSMKPAQGAINSHAKHLLGGAAHTEWCLDAHSHGQLAVSHFVEDFTTNRHSKQFFFLKNEQFWI